MRVCIRVHICFIVYMFYCFIVYMFYCLYVVYILFVYIYLFICPRRPETEILTFCRSLSKYKSPTILVQIVSNVCVRELLTYI